MSPGLPPSEALDIPVLARLFQHNTASYKYFFFLALLRRVRQNSIALKDLALDMALAAWYPAVFCRLSFGYADQLGTLVSQVPWTKVRGTWLSPKSPEWGRLRAEAAGQVDPPAVLLVPRRRDDDQPRAPLAGVL